MKPNYCTQNEGDCTSCSLSSYGRDCENNKIFTVQIDDLGSATDPEDPEWERMKKIFLQADPQTRIELLALAVFFVWRFNPKGYIEHYHQYPELWLKRIKMLILGGWIYWRTKGVKINTLPHRPE